jgi:hypothetical protein
MATLTVWKFGTAGGAQNMLSMFERLQKEELIRGRDRRQQHLRVADERSTASVALLVVESATGHDVSDPRRLYAAADGCRLRRLTVHDDSECCRLE